MPPELVQALRALGLLEAFIQEVHNQDPRLRPACLQEFQERAKKVYRKLAREAHPDLGGSTERMAQINDAMDKLQAITIRQAPPPQPYPFMQGFQVINVVMHSGFGGFSSVTNGGTTNFTSRGDWHEWPR